MAVGLVGSEATEVGRVVAMAGEATEVADWLEVDEAAFLVARVEGWADERAAAASPARLS